ncbi:hypothetical protein BBJ28_00006223 [Nothophytophthora sp. Chile5]|nr:hypothetical protein BBJ28_00006223 [Nothophytophthora sp. Chile5]
MELLLRRAAAARPVSQSRVLVASYRTKRNQAKRAAERVGSASADSSNNRKEWKERRDDGGRSRHDKGFNSRDGDGSRRNNAKGFSSRDGGRQRGDDRRDGRGDGRGGPSQQFRGDGNSQRGASHQARERGRVQHEGRGRDTHEPPHFPSVAEIEDEWTSMRSRTQVVPPPVLPARMRKEIENTRRMRRLGLLPEGDEDEVDLRKSGGFTGRREREREAPTQPLSFRDGRTAKREPEQPRSEGSRRVPARRPVSMKAKQFTNIQPAPDNVVDREFMIPDEPEEPKALDLAVIGRPNAGKSSIMNGLLDVTISAVSAKYNTTRDRVLGILTQGDAQLAFYDTPGLIKPKESHAYVQSLVTTAAETVQSVDMSLLVVDSVKRLDEAALEALEKVLTTSAQVSSPTMLVMNKCDLVGKREELNLEMKIKELSQMIEEIYSKHYDPEGTSVGVEPLAYIGENSMKVSATKGRGMQHLKQTLLSLAVDRPWNYHSSMHSDQSDLDLVTEIIREKLFRRFNKELPYSFEQENTGWTKFKDRSLRIDQDIFVRDLLHSTDDMSANPPLCMFK